MKLNIFVFILVICLVSLSKAELPLTSKKLSQIPDTLNVSSINDSLVAYDSNGNHVSFSVGIGYGAGMRVGLEVPISNSNFLQLGLGLYYANLLGGEYPPFGLEGLFTSVSLVNNQLHLFDQTSLLLSVGTTYAKALRKEGAMLYFLTGTGLQIGNSNGEHFQLGLGVGYHWMVVQGSREGDDGFFPNVDFLFVF